MQMSQTRRQLMLRVWDGDERVLPYLHILHHLRRCDEILRWLIEVGFTGKQFMAWAKSEHGQSILSPMQEAISRLEREKAGRPILIGRDYVPGTH